MREVPPCSSINDFQCLLPTTKKVFPRPLFATCTILHYCSGLLPDVQVFATGQEPRSDLSPMARKMQTLLPGNVSILAVTCARRPFTRLVEAA
jgi:hypothetical protein